MEKRLSLDFPARNVIIERMGKSDGHLDLRQIMRDLVVAVIVALCGGA